MNVILLAMWLRKIGNVFLFMASGIAVIIVGFFMLRGNMSMWDKSPQSDVNVENHNTHDDKDDNNDNKKPNDNDK